MAATDLAPGATFGPGGRYRIERLLSTGGMATVWLGHDQRLHRLVALKFLSDVLALDHDYVARFTREARVAAQLSHPNLVAIYDFSAEPPRPFLVMEYIAGGTLADRLRTDRCDVDAAQVIRDLLEAVAAIHRAGVIHRDIKPANVLVASDGRIRLTDFGIAQPAEATRMTQTGIVLGTARYLAPEVLQGHPADARSDLYACGVVLEAMLAPEGRVPSPLTALAKHLTEEDPERRPRTAADALALLDGGADARTGPTRRVSASQPIGESGQRRTVRVRLDPRIVAVAALVVIGLTIALAAGGGGEAGPSPLPPRSAPLTSQLRYLDQAIDAARR